MADVWAQAPIEVVITVIKESTPQGGGPQEKGKYPPEKDMLKWGVKFGDNTHFSNLFANTPPKAGDTVKVREYWKDENGEKKFVKWFLESDYEAIKAGGKKGGGFGGKSTNYVLEQEAMKDALGIVAPLFIAGAYKDKDGHPLPPTSENLKGAASKVAGVIIEGYKKPD